MRAKITLAAILAVVSTQFAAAQITAGVESGAVFTGYNDVRIPGDGGTKLSFSDELSGGTSFYYRLNVDYAIGDRHHISAQFAPLQTSYSGSVDRDILFANTLFAANTQLDATFKFNSYRLTYRYDIVKRPAIEFGLGFTAKIRDAKIAISAPTYGDSKSNFGFVPIINFRLKWNYNENLGVLLQGDALAAPQGRAEDILIAISYKASEKVGLYGGYRMLEGGSDGGSVYTFSGFNYIALGATYYFDLCKNGR